MLPDGFHWIPRMEHDNGEVALVVGDLWIAQLLRRLDGTWFAVLTPHADQDHRQLRGCTSFDAGKAGVERWACRHEAGLRAQAALKVLPYRAWLPRPRASDDS